MKNDALCLYCGNEFCFHVIRKCCPKCNESKLLRRIDHRNEKLDQYAGDPRPWPSAKKERKAPDYMYDPGMIWD